MSAPGTNGNGRHHTDDEGERAARALRLSQALPPDPVIPADHVPDGTLGEALRAGGIPALEAPGEETPADVVRQLLQVRLGSQQRADGHYVWPEACPCGGDVLTHDTGEAECTSCQGDVAALIAEALEGERERGATAASSTTQPEDQVTADADDNASDPPPTTPPTASRTKRRLELVRFSDIKPERVEFIEGGRIALGKLTFLAGVPGLGKSTYSIMIAAKVAQTHPVLMVNAEDSDGDTMKPRLAAAGADVRNVFTAKLQRGQDDGGGLVLPDDAALLREEVKREGIKLVVVDPIMAHLDGTINSHKDQDVRQALLPLSRMGEELGCTFLVVGHLKKGDEAEVLHQIGGSTGFGGAARGALFFARHPEDPAGERGVERVLVHVKNNNGPLQPVEDYYIEPLEVDVPSPDGETVCASTSRLVYRGESAMSNRDALAGTEEQRGGQAFRAEARGPGAVDHPGGAASPRRTEG